MPDGRLRFAADRLRDRRRTRAAVPAALAACLGSVLSLLAPAPLTAQQNEDGGIPLRAVLPHDEAPDARAARASTDIRVDGRLDEAPWIDATPVTEFTQMDPDEGHPVSERTEVRFLYDDDALYVGARLLDSAPVTTRLARRDAGVPDSDFFTVTVDSYHDHRTAYRFSTNPSGMKRDEILTGGSGIFGGGRGGGGGDSSWDPVWDVATEVTGEGWFVEMRIPFSQLRFSTARDQVWGLQIERTINRNQERAVFSFTPKLEPGGVARYGHLGGIENVASGRRLEVLPYAGLSAEYIRQAAPADVTFSNPFRSGSDYFGRAGADLKYRLGSNLTLDATVNPDFGQVEVDPAVINLTAFETRFDERRPFFVEGGEIFQYARGGPGGSTGRPPTVMYSRRIGRRPQGPMASDAVFSDAPTSTTIVGAAKITGKVGDGWSVGLLEAVTGREMAPYVDGGGIRGEAELEPSTNYLAGRLRRDLRAGLTQLGAMATAVNRNLSASVLGDRLHSSAYVAGVDFIHEWEDRSWRINGAFSRSLVSGSEAAILRTQRASARYLQRPDGNRALDPDATSLGGHYAMFDVNKQSGSFTARLAMASISPGYEVNDIGFQTEADRVMLDTHLTWRQPRPGTWLRNWSISGGPDGKWNTAGDRLHSEFNANLNWQWLNYWGGSVRGVIRAPTDNDRLTRGGPLARDPRYYAGNANLSSDSRQPVSGRASYNWSFDEAGSWSHTGSLDVTYKSGEKLELRLGPRLTRSYSEAQYVASRADPLATATSGHRYIFAPIDQTTLSVDTRLNVTFSPTLTLQVYAQPLMSSGDYGGLKEFRAPGTFDFLRYGQDAGTMYRLADGGFLIDPDGPGSAPKITIADRDFNVRSLRGNAVLRWEWSPGSTLFLVWQQRRYHRALRDAWDPLASDGIGDFDFRHDAGELVRIRPDNIFLVKVNYWLNL